MELTAERWAQAAFEDKDLSPNPEKFDYDYKGVFESATGLERPEEQLRLLGRVASAVLGANTLQEPQTVIWHRQEVTLHVRPDSVVADPIS